MQLFSPAPVQQAPLRMTEQSVPKPAANQVLVRVLACGVCHTDLHIVEGELMPPAYPVTPGHQVVGVVEEVGEGVPDDCLGQRVGLYWLSSTCGECEFCRRGLENLCPSAMFTGLHIPGGFADYMLADYRFMVRIPDKITDEQAAPLLCAGIIGYRSLKKSELHAGEKLGLIGFGASAHLVAQVAAYWGCPVYVFTRSPAHQKHALQLGAEWAGAPDQPPPCLLDRVILFAPAGELVPTALKVVRPGGTVAINAVHLSPIPALPYDLIYGERTLRSVAHVTRQDAIEFIQLAQQIGIHSTVQLYDLLDVNHALLDLKNSRFNGEAVLKVAS